MFWAKVLKKVMKKIGETAPQIYLNLYYPYDVSSASIVIMLNI